MKYFKNSIVISKTYLVRNNPLFENRIENKEFNINLVDCNNLNDAKWFNDIKQIETFKHFLEKNYIGFYCYFKSKCIHRLWIFTDSDRTYLNQYFIYPLKNEFFIAWVETASEYRKLGAFNQTINYVTHYFPNKDFIAAIDSKNYKSLKAFLTNGFKIYKSFLLIKFFRLKLSILYKKNNTICFKPNIGTKV